MIFRMLPANIISRKITIIIILMIFFPVMMIASDSNCMTLHEELELSKKIMEIIEKESILVKDSSSLKYLNAIGEKITKPIDNNPYQFTFHIVDNQNLNAFAVPGGHVFINTGLIAALQSEEELAAVLAHEIAHIVCRHISKTTERSSKISLASTAIKLAGILIAGNKHSPNIAKATILTQACIENTVKKAFTRENELQADQIGIHYLQQAGYTGKGMLASLKTIHKSSFDYSNNGVSQYLNTHPSFKVRLKYIESWLQQHKKPTMKITSQIKKFELFHTKIVALFEPERSTFNRFKALVEKYPENDLINYGYSLLLTRSKNWPIAIEHMKKAINNTTLPQNMLFELGKMYFKDKQYEKAIAVLNTCPSNNDPSVSFALARSQMELGMLKIGKKTLENLINNDNNYVESYFFLSKINMLEGNTMAAHYNLGIYHSKNFNHQKAIFQFKKSLTHTDNQYQIKKIEALLEKEKSYIH